MRVLKEGKILILYLTHAIMSADCLALVSNSINDTVLEDNERNLTAITSPTLEQPMKMKEETPRVDIKEVFRSVCARQVDVLCIKLSLILLVDKLASRPSSVEIYPGVSIQQGTHPSPGTNTTTKTPTPNHTPSRLLVKTAIDTPEILDEVVLSSIHDYLRSLSLNIHILDNTQLHKFRRFGEEALPTLIANGQHQTTGRGKNKGYGGVAMAGLITGGSMLALALSGLAAMAGKAMMTALMAMMMALICLLKGHGGGGHGGGGGKSSHYEVIAHPYFTKEQSHSAAEYQADQAGIYHAHAHSHGIGRAFELNRTEDGVQGYEAGYEAGYEPQGLWGNPQVDHGKGYRERLYNFDRNGRQQEIPADDVLAAMF